MSKLQAFVREVNRKKRLRAVEKADSVLISKENAIEAAEFIDKRLKAGAKGGKTRTRVLSEDPKKVAKRKAQQRWRSKKLGDLE